MLGWRVLKFEIVDRAGSLPILHAIFHATVLVENQLFLGLAVGIHLICQWQRMILLISEKF